MSSLWSCFEEEVWVPLVLFLKFVHPAIECVLGNYHHACLLCVLILLERAQIVEKAINDLLCIVRCYLSLLCYSYLCFKLSQRLYLANQLEFG